MINKGDLFDKLQKSEKETEEGRIVKADSKMSVKEIDDLLLGNKYDRKKDNKSTEGTES